MEPETVNRERKKQRGLEQRKACDLCHVKRIKCDAKKPDCSHCTMYGKKCEYTPFIKKRQKQLKLARSQAGNKSAAGDSQTTLHNQTVVSATKRNSPGVERGTAAKTNAFQSTSETETEASSTYAPCRPLPSLPEILPLIEDYFSYFNTTLPLFNQRVFMRMLLQWDSNRIVADPSAEAAISTVLALALQRRATRNRLPDNIDIDHLISNAQSYMSILVTRVQDLRGLQVLLGLTILFQGTPNHQPALVLIAAAVQLAHRLRLHERVEDNVVDAETVLARNRVFWIMYIIDKDINVRASVPYLQQDCDTSLDGPEVFSHVDPAIRGLDGQLSFDFLAARFHLARIQGRIYDWTQSAANRRRPLHEKKPQADRLDQILRDWTQAVPVDFEADELPEDLSECASRELLILRFDHVYLLFQIHGVFMHDSGWIKRLTKYSENYASARPRTDDARSLNIVTDSWPELLNASRRCMRLFRAVDESDSAIIWNLACTYLSAMIMLIVNKLTLMDQDGLQYPEGDDDLISKALGFLDRRQQGSARLTKLHTACSELNRRASVSAMNFWLDQGRDAHDAPWTVSPDVLPDGTLRVCDLLEVFTQAEVKPLASVHFVA